MYVDSILTLDVYLYLKVVLLLGYKLQFHFILLVQFSWMGKQKYQRVNNTKSYSVQKHWRSVVVESVSQDTRSESSDSYYKCTVSFIGLLNLTVICIFWLHKSSVFFSSDLPVLPQMTNDFTWTIHHYI